MKGLVVGCAVALLGLFVGVIVTLGAMSLWSSQSAVIAAAPAVSPASADVSINASAAFLGAQMQQTFKQSNLARQATFAFASPNIVRATMLVDLPVLGKTTQVNATITCRLAAQNGKVVLTVDNVDVAGVNVPQNVVSQTTERVRAQIETQINQMMQRMLQGTTLRLQGISVDPNQITMQFKAQ